MVTTSALETCIAKTEIVERCLLCGGDSADTLFETVDRHYDLPGKFAFVRCRECQLVRLSPRPTSGRLQCYYPEAEYYSYQPPLPVTEISASASAGRALRERIRETVLNSKGYPVPPQARWQKALQPLFATLFRSRTFYGVAHRYPDYQPNGVALDIGCGIGVYLNYLKRHGWRVAGIELSADVAGAARQLFDIDVFPGGLKYAPFEPASFDFIHMNHVIEHMPDPVEQLQVVARLLKPGGRLYIGTPNVDSFNCKASGRYWFHWDAPRHLHLFSPCTLRRALGKAGLEVTSLRTALGHHHDWEDTYKREKYMQQRLRNRPYLSPSARPRAAMLTVAAYLSHLLNPLNGDEIQLWSIKK